MTKRSIGGVIVLCLVTFGIYSIYWEVKTKDEMVSMGADIPTAWLLIIPIANIYWLWKYSVGVEQVLRGRMSGGVAFVLMLFLRGVIAPAILQSMFNDIADQQRPALPMARTL